MSIDLLLDEVTNDLVLRDSNFQLTSSKPQFLRQRMSITFKTFTEEWFWNLDFGAINKNIIFRKGVSKAEVDGWFLSIIHNFPEVISVTQLESSQDAVTRMYNLTFTVLTDEGEVAVFMRSGRPDLEITYPTPSDLPVDFSDCGVSIADANRLYKLINIDIPVNIPWD